VKYLFFLKFKQVYHSIELGSHWACTNIWWNALFFFRQWQCWSDV